MRAVVTREAPPKGVLPPSSLREGMGKATHMQDAEKVTVEGSMQTYESDVVDERVVKDALKQYFLTPEELRAGATGLPVLAGKLGLSEAALTKVMARSPEIANEVMSVVALAGMQHVPRVLANLLEASNAGSVRASEIFLEWIRKTVQNEELLKHGGGIGTMNVNVLVQNVESATNRMLDFVKAIPEGAEAAHKALEDGTLAERQRALLSRAEVAVQSDRAIPVDPETIPMDLTRGEGEY